MTGAKIHRPPVHCITFAQLVILSAVLVLLLYMAEPVRAYSWAAGGSVAIVAQAYFAWQVFRHSGARAASQIAKSSYAGEIGKFFLAVAGFALIFALLRPISGGAVFAAYGVMLMVQLTGSWLLLRQPASRDKS